MKEFKINRDKEPKLPSKETMAKYKDYSRLSHEYDRLTKRPKVPLYKDKRMFIVLLIILLITYLVSQAVEEEEKMEQENQPVDTTQVDRS